MGWNFIGSTSNDSFILHGVDIFRGKWISTSTTANVVDPMYGVTKNFTVWRISLEDRDITFAAGEFSNNVWGIYGMK
jgi:hypothetical protein